MTPNFVKIWVSYVSFTMQILIKIGLNPAELWPKPFLLGQLLFDFPYLLGQLLAGPSIRKPRYPFALLDAAKPKRDRAPHRSEPNREPNKKKEEK